MNLQEMDSSNRIWTNEKHISFLNWMEASFVCKMLTHDRRCSPKYASGCQAPPLDRYLPDSADSTVDLNPRRDRGKVHVNPAMAETNGETSSRSAKKARRRSSGPDNSSQDQVVPELASIKLDKDERDHAACD